MAARAPERRRFVAFAALLVVSIVVAAGCSTSAAGGTATSTSGPSAAAATAGDPATDKLAQILARGTLVGYAELNYPPQSIKVDGANRKADTKCAPNQLTEPEVTGFDVETTKLVAKALGVEACFASPTWAEVTSGSWGDRVDIVYGSGAINAKRMNVLYMTQPYYAAPQRFFVLKDSPYQKPSDLDGKKIGTCTSCTVESYLKKTLSIPGVDLVDKVKNPVPVGFETEAPGLTALDKGQIDAFLAAEPVALEAIKDGHPFRLLDEPAFTMFPSGFVDKSSGKEPAAFIAKVDSIMQGLHADGTMSALALKWLGKDYTTAAAKFDLSTIGQTVP